MENRILSETTSLVVNLMKRKSHPEDRSWSTIRSHNPLRLSVPRFATRLRYTELTCWTSPTEPGFKGVNKAIYLDLTK